MHPAQLPTLYRHTMAISAWNATCDTTEFGAVNFTLFRYAPGGGLDAGVCVLLQQFASELRIPKSTLVSRLKALGIITYSEGMSSNLAVLKAAGALHPDGKVTKVTAVAMSTALASAEAKLTPVTRAQLWEFLTEQSLPRPVQQIVPPHPPLSAPQPPRQQTLLMRPPAASAPSSPNPARSVSAVVFSPLQSGEQGNSPIVYVARNIGRPPSRSSNSIRPSRSVLPSSSPGAVTAVLGAGAAAGARGGGAAASQPAPFGNAYPVSIPEKRLSMQQLKERYAIAKERLPVKLDRELRAVESWFRSPVQLDRTDTYARGVQSETWDGNDSCIRGYMGFVDRYHPSSATRAGLSLQSYSDPHVFISFISYLQARGVGKRFLNRHVSLAKKMNSYFMAGAAQQGTAVDQPDYARLATWFTTLERQLSSSMPTVTDDPGSIPDMPSVRAWVDRLAEGAKAKVLADRPGPISASTAAAVQAAVIAAMVTGRHTNGPCRLSSIKSVIHPRFVERLGECTDIDCRDKGVCLGNRFEIISAPAQGAREEEGGGDEGDSSLRVGTVQHDRRGVRFHIPHHKNERHGGLSGQAQVYDLPPQPNPFTRLLLIHMDEGHALLSRNQPGGEAQSMHLFRHTNGKSFVEDKVTFSVYWRNLMTATAPSDVPLFPPSRARKSFVEWYTVEHGDTPDLWDGSADIMGNSVRQWRDIYNVSRKRRRMQAAVDAAADDWEEEEGAGWDCDELMLQ